MTPDSGAAEPTGATTGLESDFGATTGAADEITTGAGTLASAPGTRPRLGGTGDTGATGCAVTGSAADAAAIGSETTGSGATASRTGSGVTTSTTGTRSGSSPGLDDPASGVAPVPAAGAGPRDARGPAPEPPEESADELESPESPDAPRSAAANGADITALTPSATANAPTRPTYRPYPAETALGATVLVEESAGEESDFAWAAVSSWDSGVDNTSCAFLVLAWSRDALKLDVRKLTCKPQCDVKHSHWACPG